jgi:hypothetical protein
MAQNIDKTGNDELGLKTTVLSTGNTLLPRVISKQTHTRNDFKEKIDLKSNHVVRLNCSSQKKYVNTSTVSDLNAH